MVDSFTFRGHLCIVTELLSINLYELVKANSFAGFTTTLIRRFTIQILGSLSLLRHHRVVHCDLKPEVRCDCNQPLRAPLIVFLLAEHSSQASGEERDQGHRFWEQLLREREGYVSDFPPFEARC